MNLNKIEVMWVGKQREELNIRLNEKDLFIKQVTNCVYLGGNISENGRVEVEVLEYKQERMHGEMKRGHDGQKDFHQTEGEGRGFLCGAS